MKRLWAVLCVLTLALLLSLSVLPLGADVGDFNDYDSGDSGWDSDYDSGSDSDWSGGGSGGNVGSFGILFSLGVIVFAIYAIFKSSSRYGRQIATQIAGSAVRDHTAQIVPAIQQNDPEFTADRFIAWVKEVFLTLQYAWTTRDWEKVRPFEKEELYKQHEMQLKQYIASGRINVLERININQAYLQKYVRDSEYEYLTVFLQVRMTDYIKDEKTGAVLKGSPNVDSHMKYLYTFMRRNGVRTNPASGNISTTNCPNCGAPTRITSAGKCEYCNSVITTGDFDWVLSNIDGVKPQTVIDDSGVIIRN